MASEVSLKVLFKAIEQSGAEDAPDTAAIKAQNLKSTICHM